MECRAGAGHWGGGKSGAEGPFEVSPEERVGSSRSRITGTAPDKGGDTGGAQEVHLESVEGKQEADGGLGCQGLERPLPKPGGGGGEGSAPGGWLS